MDYKYLFRIIRYVLTVLLSIGIALYIGFHMISGFAQPLDTVLVTSETARDTETLDGYIMRSETLLYANGSGSFNYLRKDGDKVAIHEPVAELYSGKESDEASAQLIDIDRRLELLNASNLGIGQTYSDTAVVDDRINALYYTLLQMNRSGETETAIQKRDDFLAYLNQRQIVTGMVENYNSQIADLQAQREQLVKSTGSVLQTVEASASGYFYADIDGFEEIFSSDKVDDMTLTDYDTMVASSADTALNRSESGGDIAGKLVDTFTWYIACETDLSSLRSYNVDTNYNVIFPYNNDETIRMKLSRIVQQTDVDRAILLFETQKVPQNFDFLRRQTVEIVRASSAGMRVPASAIRMENGKQGVYILDGYVVYFREIEPLMEIDNYLIVKSEPTGKNAVALQINDAVIVGGKNLYDGKVVS